MAEASEDVKPLREYAMVQTVDSGPPGRFMGRVEHSFAPKVMQAQTHWASNVEPGTLFAAFSGRIDRD